MADALRHAFNNDDESETIAPLPPALPGTPPAELRPHGGSFVVDELDGSATERMGSALGGAFGNLKSRVRSGLRDVAGKSRRAGDAIGDIAETAQEKAQELSQEAGARMDELRRTAYQRLHQARVAAKRTVNERPLESILAIGAAAVVMGFVLRVWRSNRD